MKRTIQRFHKEATARGIKIVSCCGYEALASDLGTFLAIDFAHKTLNRRVRSASTVVQVAEGMRQAFEYDGGFSGGSW